MLPDERRDVGAFRHDPKVTRSRVVECESNQLPSQSLPLVGGVDLRVGKCANVSAVAVGHKADPLAVDSDLVAMPIRHLLDRCPSHRHWATSS
jgi:hypothetical protein